MHENRKQPTGAAQRWLDTSHQRRGSADVITAMPPAGVQDRLDSQGQGDVQHPRCSRSRARLAAQLRVSVDSLVRLKVGHGQDAGGVFTSWPERDASGVVVGIVRGTTTAARSTCSMAVLACTCHVAGLMHLAHPAG